MDLIGVDLNGAASTHRRHLEEDSSFIAAMRDHMADDFFTQPSALMGLMDNDCTGFIVPRLSQSKVFAIVVLSSQLLVPRCFIVFTVKRSIAYFLSAGMCKQWI